MTYVPPIPSGLNIPLTVHDILQSDHLIDQIGLHANLYHQTYCELHGDDSIKPWYSEENAGGRESMLQGVRRLLIAIAEGGEINPEKNHNSWLEYKLANGWIYGPVKDEQNKEHPCMLPYAQLPAVQRYKDTLFTRAVFSFLDLFCDLSYDTYLRFMENKSNEHA